MPITLRAAVLAVLTALGLLAIISPSSPAWACSCVSPAEQEKLADLTITGTVTAITDRSVRLAVDGVERGIHPDDSITLKVGRHGSSCGYEFRDGVRYRVNSVKGATGLCTGVRELPALPVTATAAPVVAAPTAAPAPTTAPASAPDRGWLTAGAALTILIAGLLTLAVRRRRTR
jgi:hypothetical protein